MEHIPPRKKLAEMTPEERRAYNSQSKRKSRDKEKARLFAAMIPDVANYVLPENEAEDLGQYARETENRIRVELPGLTDQAAYLIAGACAVLRGFEKHYARTVANPSGVLIGGYFPDALGSELVEHVHMYPDILASPIFKSLYDKLLQEIVRWSKKHQHYITPEFIRDVQAEINGTYKLPLKPNIPKPSPEPAPPEPPVPSFYEISEQSRNRMMERLSDQLSPAAREYLFGGNR